MPSIPLLLPTLFFLLGTAPIASSSSSSSSSSLVTDFQALVALKQGFRSPDPALSSWDPANSSSVCSWAGIRCLLNRVVSVDLTGLDLQGSVSFTAMAGLDGLSLFSLSSNNLTGTIEIRNSSRLRFLNISDNRFDGGLDWNYSTLPDLEVFDAYDNNFRGPLPGGIPSLRRLRHLNLAGNFFTGGIPRGYGGMAGLEYLSIAGNDLHGRIPAELGNLTGVRQIYLGYYNVFDGGIPAELGNLAGTVHMDLSSCGLDGRIPRELGNLRLLDTLFLHTNALTGEIPRRLGNLTAMVNLDLSNNALTGEIPPELARLTGIRHLDLFMNRLHGSIPGFVADLPELETLALWRNNFTGEIPGWLGRNRKLRSIDLSSNKLTGTIPTDLCSSQRLEILILLKNFLFGPIPESLGSCRSLVRLRLGQNFLNGSIPECFLYLPRLNQVELHENYLSGNLSENRNCSSEPVGLIGLHLYGNLLSGNLPFSLSNYSSIENLLMGGNRFSGPITPSIGDLRQLVKLDLSRNSLVGAIPPEIGGCIHLTSLDLSHNNLTGEIPPEISNIRILNYLNLSRNHLNQTIPKSIGSMKSLTVADFSFNDLSGNLPDSGQFTFFNASSFAGNPNLCGASILNSFCNNATGGDVNFPKKASKDFKLVFALGLLACSLIFAAAAIIKARSFKRSRRNLESWKLTAFQKLDFAVADVLECVKDGNVIGSGGAGVVYHGKTPGGAEIAVKKLLGIGGGGGGGGGSCNDRGLQAEIETLGHIRHRNIVRLLGFCSSKETNLLIYEYMRNGSLGEALHGKKGGVGLGWDLRYSIAVDAARGLCYLHHDCSPLIVHRDVKSNNILLDSSFEAHVADFGLAKYLFHEGGASQCMSAVAGSYGYIAPEYAYTLSVNEKSDVYSYGVVLLELITGRRPVGSFGEDVDIVQWTRRTTGCRWDVVSLILDPRLPAGAPLEEATHVLFVAMLCVQEDSVQRPTMREVVQMLSEFPRRSSEPERSSPPPSSTISDQKGS